MDSRSGSSRWRPQDQVVSLEQWRRDRPSRKVRRQATVLVDHVQRQHPGERTHPSDGGSRRHPLGEDGLPAWFPSEAPRQQNSAVLLGLPDGAAYLCAMSGAGHWGVQILGRCGYDIAASSFDSTTAGGHPIVEYREIRLHGVEPGPERIAELGRLLRRHGVVAHAYVAQQLREQDRPLRFQRVGGTTAFPDLPILHRVTFSHGLGVHHLGHPRQLVDLLRRAPDDVEPVEVPAEDGRLGALISPPELARQMEETYEEAGGSVHVSAFEFVDGQAPAA